MSGPAVISMVPIPIRAAAHVARRYGYDQVIIIARRVGNGGGEHVTTYGRDTTHCGVAARVGAFLKHKVMGWPEYTVKPEQQDQLSAAEERIARALALLATEPDVDPAKMTRAEIRQVVLLRHQVCAVLKPEPPSRRGEAAEERP